MSVPLAHIVEMSVNTGTIINDNSDDLINTNIEAKQLINQIARIEQDYVITLEPQSRRTFFSITIPNRISRVQRDSLPLRSQYNRKLKIMCVMIFLCYTSIICFTVIFLSRNSKEWSLS